MNKSILIPNSWSNVSDLTGPDYLGLVEFLVEPLLEPPNSLSVDCEQVNRNQLVWIRLAFKGNDKGQVFGRICCRFQAIRIVL